MSALEPWRQLNLEAGRRAFGELLAQTANAGVFFTQQQQKVVELLCMVAGSQAMRSLAAHPDRETMIRAINADTMEAKA
jgi:hypothetical protein